MKPHLVTFADGNDSLRASAVRLASQANETGWFVNSSALHMEDLGKFSPSWLNRHQAFIQSNSRGFGYWIWKPFIIFESLKRIEFGEYIVMADAGYEISKAGHGRFQQYMELASAFDFLGFEITNERIAKWTKGDLLKHMGIAYNSPLLQANQIQGGLMIIKKTLKNLLFFDHWAELAVTQDYALINDAPSIYPNPLEFQEHRHDQAIFSLLARMSNIGYYLTAEDYYPELFNVGKYMPFFPFQCLRNRTGVRMIT